MSTSLTNAIEIYDDAEQVFNLRRVRLGTDVDFDGSITSSIPYYTASGGVQFSAEAATGNMLVWDGSSWTPNNIGTGIAEQISLTDLKDVSGTGTNGDVLVANGSIFQPIPLTANLISTVGVQTGDFIVNIGGEFTGTTVGINTLDDATITAPYQSEFLSYVNGLWINVGSSAHCELTTGTDISIASAGGALSGLGAGSVVISPLSGDRYAVLNSGDTLGFTYNGTPTIDVKVEVEITCRVKINLSLPTSQILRTLIISNNAAVSTNSTAISVIRHVWTNVCYTYMQRVSNGETISPRFGFESAAPVSAIFEIHSARLNVAYQQQTI